MNNNSQSMERLGKLNIKALRTLYDTLTLDDQRLFAKEIINKTKEAVLSELDLSEKDKQLLMLDERTY